MNQVLALVGLAISAFVAFGFFKAGKFKATATRETMLGAGFGWIEKLPTSTVRLIAWLELAGALGIVLAPLVAYLVPGFGWAQIWGVLAAAGLALTMVVAFIMHAVRGEAKYTWKGNLSLLSMSVIAGVLQSLVVLPVL